MSLRLSAQLLPALGGRPLPPVLGLELHLNILSPGALPSHQLLKESYDLTWTEHAKHTVAVRNLKQPEILLYLQTHQVISNSVLDAGGRNETPRLDEQFISHSTSSIQRIIIFLWQVSEPHFPQDSVAHPTEARWCLHGEWMHFRRGTSTSETWIFYNRLPTPCSLPWKETLSLLYWTNLPFTWKWDTVSIF